MKSGRTLFRGAAFTEKSVVPALKESDDDAEIEEWLDCFDVLVSWSLPSLASATFANIT